MAHDPPTAWLIVAAYALGTLLAWAAHREALERRERNFWLIAAIFLLLMGLNKQLDLQTLLSDSVRSMAKAQGWYEARRLVQGVFILALCLGAAAGAALLAAADSVHPGPRRHRPPHRLLGDDRGGGDAHRPMAGTRRDRRRRGLGAGVPKTAIEAG
jgi:hypothetical protein